MIEGTPGQPYGATGLCITSYSVPDFITCEKNMILRRQVIEGELGKNEYVLSITNFGLMGVPGPFSVPTEPPRGPIANSQFTPDMLIHPHFRFA